MNQLLQDRKLVLVLDLDNTLLHTKSIEEREFQTKSRDPTFINLIDPLKSIYEIKLFRGGFHTKLRPFLFEFLKKVFDERKFEIYFYTAGTKDYGMLIIDIFKMEITRLFGKEYAKQISEELSHRKLISRCDKERFANKNASHEIDIDSMQQQLYYQIENQQMGLGGDATLNMKHFIKSLSSLAGGDEILLRQINIVKLLEYQEINQCYKSIDSLPFTITLDLVFVFISNLIIIISCFM